MPHQANHVLLDVTKCDMIYNIQRHTIKLIIIVQYQLEYPYSGPSSVVWIPACVFFYLLFFYYTLLPLTFQCSAFTTNLLVHFPPQNCCIKTREAVAFTLVFSGGHNVVTMTSEPPSKVVLQIRLQAVLSPF